MGCSSKNGGGLLRPADLPLVKRIGRRLNYSIIVYFLFQSRTFWCVYKSEQLCRNQQRRMVCYVKPSWEFATWNPSMPYDIMPPAERAVCEHVRPIPLHTGVLFFIPIKLVKANSREGFSFVTVVPLFFLAFYCWSFRSALCLSGYWISVFLTCFPTV